MRLTRWMAVSKGGQVRVVSNQPTLKPGEISLLMAVSIPDELFDRPHLKANITLDAPGIQNEVTAQVAQNIQDTVNKNLGLNLHVNIIDPKDKASYEGI